MGTGGSAALAGVDPIAMVPLGRGDSGLGFLVLAGFADRDKTRAAGPAFSHELALFPNEHDPVTATDVVGTEPEFLHAEGHHAAVPGEFDRRFGPAGREAVLDHGSVWRSIFVVAHAPRFNGVGVTTSTASMDFSLSSISRKSI